MKKLSYEFVKSKFDEVNYILLSKEYKDAHSKLEYLCDKGHKNSMKWDHFRAGHRCPDCCKNRKIDLNHIKLEFNKLGYILLTTEYKNAHSNLKFICDKGHNEIVKWMNFKKGSKCNSCRKILLSGSTNFMWKGGVRKLNLPLYDTYAHQINFCEEVRRDPDNNNLLQVRCTEINCRKWFTPYRSDLSNRIISLKNNTGENRFYCSDECKNSCSIFHQKIYPKGFKVDRSREVQPELAAMVFERDGYECQRCGNKADLECHHYEGIEQNPIESADVDACVTLCEACHSLAHKDIGCRRIDLTKAQLCK